MALWRVLDKTSAPLRGASSTRHNRLNTTKKINRETAGKAKRRRKSGGAVNPLRTPDFFYAAAILAFFYAAILLSAVLFAPSFLLPYTFRNFAVTLCDVVLLYNPFVTVNATALFFAMWYNRLRLNKHGQSFFDLFTK